MYRFDIWIKTRSSTQVFADTFIYVLGLRDVREAMRQLRFYLHRKWISFFKESSDENYIYYDNLHQRSSGFRSTRTTYISTIKTANKSNISCQEFAMVPLNKKRTSAPNISLQYPNGCDFSTGSKLDNADINTLIPSPNKQIRSKSVQEISDIELKGITAR